MRRIPRTSRSIGLLQRQNTAPRTSYICSTCRTQAPSFSTTPLRFTSRTEAIRRRIWGTDEPPGLADPYGGKSRFEQRAEERERREEDTVEVEPAREQKLERVSIGELPADYEPAQTWDGLEEVGEVGDGSDPARAFRGFTPVAAVTDSEEMTAALHRAMVEVFALKQAGRPLLEVSQAIPSEDMTWDVQVLPSAGGAELQFTKGSSLEKVLDSLASNGGDETVEKENPTESEEDVAADRSETNLDKLIEDSYTVEEEGKPTEAEEDVAADRSEEDPLQASESILTYEDLLATWNPAWLRVSVEDPEVKFAILKRTWQLTGVRIPDAAFNSAKTASALLSQLVTPPKPRRVIDALEQKDDLRSLPNVQIFARRVTPIHKEKAIGRWKLIEKELKQKGLPVTGHEA